MKRQLETLSQRLKALPERVFFLSELALDSMKRRIFERGLRADLKPIGVYRTGRRRGKPVKLKNTGRLEKSLKAIPTKRGAVIVGDKKKVVWTERRYGKIFSFSEKEKDFIVKQIKKY